MCCGLPLTLSIVSIPALNPRVRACVCCSMAEFDDLLNDAVGEADVPADDDLDDLLAMAASAK